MAGAVMGVARSGSGDNLRQQSTRRGNRASAEWPGQAGLISLGLVLLLAGLALLVLLNRHSAQTAIRELGAVVVAADFSATYQPINARLYAANDDQSEREDGNPSSDAQAKERRFVQRQILIMFSGFGMYGLFILIWVQRSFYAGGFGKNGDRIGQTCFLLALVSVFGALALAALLSWRHNG